VIGADRAELLAGTAALADERPLPSVVSGVAGETGKVAFVFGGQGAQWVGMGRELLDSSTVFADALADCDRALAARIGWSTVDVVRGADGAPCMDRVDVVQPVLFAIMVSIARLWASVGVRPVAVLGHSQGEIAAACVAGVLSLDDAALLVTSRSRALM
jgi:acyl transferase domain-containing protein